MGHQILTWLATNVCSSKNMFQLVISMALLWQGAQLQQINTVISEETHTAKTEYAYNVLKYGYRNDTTEEEIVQTTKKWVEEGHASRVAALVTLCDESPNRLNTLVSPKNVITLCRYAR